MNGSYCCYLIRLLLFSSFNDVLRRVLLGRACLQALCVKTLARTGMTTGSAAFATTHGVIDRVHDNAAVARATAEPAGTAGLAGTLERVLAVTHGADSGLAGSENLAGFAGRQFDDSIVPFAGDELGESAGRTCHEGALAGTKFDAVDKGTDGDGAQGKSVSYFGSGISAAEERRTYLEAVGGDDVGLDAVNVVEKGDAGRPVGVVLDALYYCGDSVESSLKVYDTVFALVSTTKVASGEMTFGITCLLYTSPSPRD